MPGRWDDPLPGSVYTVYIPRVPTSTPSRSTGLTPDEIVTVAHRLIAHHGLAWFSMRKLAAELDVNPMTVYLRFESKDALLRAVAERGLRDLTLPEPVDGPWEERALGLATALRRHLLRDRHLLALYGDAPGLAVSVIDATDQGLALMEEAGYRGPEAVAAFRALFWHTVGFTRLHHDFAEFPANGDGGLPDAVGPIEPDRHPTFARLLPHFGAVDGDELFQHTTRLLVAGLAAGVHGAVPPDERTNP